MIYRQFPPHFVIKDGIQGVGVFVVSDFKKGSVLFTLTGDIVKYPSRTSVQLGDGKHVENDIAGHINHNCKPNVKVDRSAPAFVCLRDVKKGEEITFDYNSNEELLSAPFSCGCCGKLIAGKKMLFPKEFNKPKINKKSPGIKTE